MIVLVAPFKLTFPLPTNTNAAEPPTVKTPPFTTFAEAVPDTVTDPPLNVPATKVTVDTVPLDTFACRAPPTVTLPAEILPATMEAFPAKFVTPFPERLLSATDPPANPTLPALLTAP